MKLLTTDRTDRLRTDCAAKCPWVFPDTYGDSWGARTERTLYYIHLNLSKERVHVYEEPPHVLRNIPLRSVRRVRGEGVRLCHADQGHLDQARSNTD